MELVARGGGRVSRFTPTGCLESAGIAVFALIVGAFAMSTWMRHGASSGEEEAAAPPGEARRPLPPEERARIRVEVLNGSGDPGAAARTTEFLRGRGFDVVDFGNAESFDQRRTVVVDRIGDPRPAREVAGALRGVPIEADPDSSLFLDVTVRLGADWVAVLDRAEGGAEEDRDRWERWWDRVRRWRPPWP